MIKADNTQKRCFVACDEQTKKDGRCSCHSNTHQALQLQQTDVIVRSEQLKTCEHNFADIYDHTGTQIIGKKCLNGCGF